MATLPSIEGDYNATKTRCTHANVFNLLEIECFMVSATNGESIQLAIEGINTAGAFEVEGTEFLLVPLADFEDFSKA